MASPSRGGRSARAPLEHQLLLRGKQSSGVTLVWGMFRVDAHAQAQAARAQMQAVREHAHAQAQAARAQAQAARAHTQAARAQAHAEAQTMRAQAQAAQQQARAQAVATRTQLQAQGERMRTQARAQAEQMQAQMQQMPRDFEQRMSQEPLASATQWPDSHFSSSGMNSVTTEVRNGTVFINGQAVARPDGGGGISVQTINGRVLVNGEAVWPRADAGALPVAQGHAVGRRGRPHSRMQAAEATALRHSLVSTRGPPCEGDEPCAVCLEDIREGDETRTLPCFHCFHRQCAEAAFCQAANAAAASNNGSSPSAVCCPVCRCPVGPEIVDFDQ